MSTTPHSFYIQAVRSTEDLEVTINLFRAYAESLGIDLSYQDFDTEMKCMPGKYAPPSGELLLAKDTATSEPVGCVGLRPIQPDGCCEMKRLYVSPAGRRRGLGRALVQEVLDVAKRLGYTEIRLDTLPSMLSALALYKQFGFVEIPAYYPTPIAATVFLGRKLNNLAHTDPVDHH